MVAWLRDDSGVRVPLGPAGTLIGRSADCHIVVDDPEVSRRHVLILHAEGGTQVIPLGRRKPELRGARIHGPAWAEDGDELVVGHARFAFDIRTAPNKQREEPIAPTAVRYRPTDEGARLTIVVGKEHVVELAQKRADLVLALLCPPNGLPGEWVEDEVAWELIWGRDGGTRARLNTLIHRTRASLSEAGLDGARLIERAPGGGATRFALAPKAKVSIRRRP